MSRFSQFAYVPKEAPVPMDIDDVPYPTYPELRLHQKVMDAIFQPDTIPQRALKIQFERAFQNYILEWISYQGNICNMHKHMSGKGIILFWIKDALKSMCPVCLKKIFKEEWEKSECAQIKFAVLFEVEHICAPEFPILNFLNKDKFRSSLEESVAYMPLPRVKYPPCIC